MLDVSVITPTYNRVHLLPRAWASLKDQKCAFEWIVVDDGSIDNTREVIEAIGDPRIIYYSLNRNFGVNVARNRGAAIAKGRYVIFLDSDDELYPGSMTLMVSVMDGADNAIGAACFACVSGSTGKKISIMTDGAILDEIDIVCRNVLKAEMIFIYRNEVCKRFLLPEDLKGCEGLFLREISKVYKFLMVDKPGRIYHRQGDNITNARSIVGYSHDIAEYYERILKNHAEALKMHPFAVTWHLEKMLYRYGVAGNRRGVWRTYCRIVRHSLAPLHLLEATALLLLGMVGSARFEMWRVNRINKRFWR